jgi:hypothetical protein
MRLIIFLLYLKLFYRKLDIFMRDFIYIISFSIISICLSSNAFAEELNSPQYILKMSIDAQDSFHSCKSGNYEMCNAFAQMVIQRGNQNEDLGSADIAAPFFKEACSHDVFWGCANLGLIYRNGTPKIPSDLSAAKLYYNKACTGNGDEGKAIPLACKWRDQLSSVK